jgi:hypothetical protein
VARPLQLARANMKGLGLVFVHRGLERAESAFADPSAVDCLDGDVEQTLERVRF